MILQYNTFLYVLLVGSLDDDQARMQATESRDLAAASPYWLPTKTLLTLGSAGYLGEGSLAVRAFGSHMRLDDRLELAAGVIRNGLLLSGHEVDWNLEFGDEAAIRFVNAHARTNAHCGEDYRLRADMLGGPDFTQQWGTNITIVEYLLGDLGTIPAIRRLGANTTSFDVAAKATSFDAAANATSFDAAANATNVSVNATSFDAASLGRGSVQSKGNESIGNGSVVQSNGSIGGSVQSKSQGTGWSPAPVDNSSIRIGWYSHVNAPLVLRKGGVFKLCFSDDTTFRAPGHAQLLDVGFLAMGVWDRCPGDDCLAKKPVLCHFLGTNEKLTIKSSGCFLKFDGIVGDPINFTWTAKFNASYSDVYYPNASYVKHGQEHSVGAPLCGTGPAQSGLFRPDGTLPNTTQKRDWLESYIPTGGGVRLDFLPSSSWPHTPVTVAVCYCPGINNRTCDSTGLFTQQVGIIYIYTSSICNPSEFESCASKYNAVAAGQRFALRVFCPPLGCASSTSSRVKLVLRNSSHLLAAWDQHNGCRLAKHLGGWLPRGNCISATDCAFNGGFRQDWKNWGRDGNWWAWQAPGLTRGAERPDLRGNISEPTYDICFRDQQEWFRVGTLRVAPVRLADSALVNYTDNAGSEKQFQNLMAINVPGVVSLIRSLHNIENITFGQESGGLIKLVEDPWIQATGDTCDAAPYNSNARGVQGLRSVPDTRARDGVYEGYDHMVFNGGDDSKQIVADRAGVFAVCYCAQLLAAGNCASGGFYVAARLTVSGPSLGQTWTVSIGGLFHISYTGHGLEATNTLRFSDAPCSGPAPTPSARIAAGCPGNCETGVPQSDNIATIVQTHKTVECDEMGQNCVFAPIVAVAPGTDGTELTFRADPFLDYGDEISIDPFREKGVKGGTEEQLDALRGRFRYFTRTRTPAQQHERYKKWFNNLKEGDPVEVLIPTGYWMNATAVVRQDKFRSILGVPSWMLKLFAGTSAPYRTFPEGNVREPHYIREPEYLVAHKIHDGPNLLKRKIKLSFGDTWDSMPTFSISPKFEFGLDYAGGIEWTRHNKAYTKRELIAADDADLEKPVHVCWSAGSQYGYTAEVGTVSFARSPSMAKSVFSLVAPIINEETPAVVAFETSRRPYPLAEGGTSLVLRFIDTASVEPLTVTGREAGPGESRKLGTQSLCGQFLLEAWSSRDDIGFPLPRGCRFNLYRVPYNGAPNRTVTEVEIEFEPKNGLEANTSYQLVFNVRVNGFVSTSQTFLEIVAHNDLRTQPNHAIESSNPPLSIFGNLPLVYKTNITESDVLSATVASSGPAHTSHKSPAGTFDLTTLVGPDNVDVPLELTGNWRSIEQGAKLRVLMWPLLQWELRETASIVGCFGYFTCSASITTTAIESVVRGQKNSLVLSDILVSYIGNNTAALLGSSRRLAGGAPNYSSAASNSSTVTTVTTTSKAQGSTTKSNSIVNTNSSSDVSVPSSMKYAAVNDSNLSAMNTGGSAGTSGGISSQPGNEPTYNYTTVTGRPANWSCNCTNWSAIVPPAPTPAPTTTTSTTTTTMPGAPILDMRNVGRVVGGFFLARPSVVYTNADSSIISYFHHRNGPAWHLPSTTFAMFVSARGDGNEDPFVGETNALYARILFMVGLPMYTSLSIQSPPLYSGCGSAEVLPFLGHWRPSPVTLNTTLPPWGTGALRQTSWATSSTASQESNAVRYSCTWRYAVASPNRSGIHQGSSAFVLLNVDNPTRSVRSYEAVNTWKLTLHNAWYDLSMTANFQVPSMLKNQSNYATTVDVMKMLPYVSMSPSLSTPNSQQILWIFFTIEQLLHPHGTIEITAPFDFDFGKTCQVHNLTTEQYYRYGKGGAGAILERIPRVETCSGQTWPLHALAHTQALVKIGGPLFPFWRYGFGITVKNSPNYIEYQHILWSLRTVDMYGSSLDANRGCISFTGRPNRNCSEAWGLYAEKLTGINLLFGELLPWFYTRTVSYVTVFPMSFPRDFSAPMRVLAPDGFEWQTTQAYWQNKPPAASGTFPGGFPRINMKTQLIWETPLSFKRGITYGFRMPLDIHLWPVTFDAFYVEFGLRAANLSNKVLRPFLGHATGPMSRLRVVRNASVDYITGRVGQIQTVSIRLTTVSPVFPGEGFVFQGFAAGGKNTQLNCLCPTGLTGLTCTTDRNLITFELIVRLLAQQSIPAGVKVFPLTCSNPLLLVPTSNWTLGTYSSPPQYPNSVPVDGYATVAGFAIIRDLPFFTRYPGTLASFYDPRPLRRSSALLGFRLGTSSGANTNPSRARLRAPYGTVFADDCLDEITTAQTQVFGHNVALPFNTTVLPTVYVCRGVAHVANITWDKTLTRGINYVFRVNPYNPPFAPNNNVWTIELDGEASLPIGAAHVNAFTNVSVVFTSYGSRMHGGTVGDQHCNVMRFVFTPSHWASSLSIWAPAGYDFGNRTTCSGVKVSRRPLPYLATDAPTVALLQSCNSSTAGFNIFFQSPSHNITGGSAFQYLVEVSVLNPKSKVVGDSDQFRLQGHAPGAYRNFGDEVFIDTPDVWSNAQEFIVLNVANIIGSGLSVTTELSVTFGREIQSNERMFIDLPKNFMLYGAKPYKSFDVNPCPIIWRIPGSFGPEFVSCRCTYTNCRISYAVLPPTPGQTNISLRVTAPWPSDGKLKFEVVVVNPLFLPEDFDNVWSMSVYPSSTASNAAQPHVITTYAGWRVTPRLGSVAISPHYTVRRAGAFSNISISFVPPNQATRLKLTGHAPSGWDFRLSAVCPTSVSNCVASSTATLSPNAPNVLIANIWIQVGVRFEAVIRNVTLANVGGQTSFEVETFTMDQGGSWNKLDSSGVFNGYLLPGAVIPFNASLRTKRAAVDDTGDPFWAKLPPRVGLHEAIVSFNFNLTRPTQGGDYIQVLTNSGALAASTVYVAIFLMEGAVPAKFSVPLTVQQIGSKEIRVTLSYGLLAMPAYYRAQISMFVTQVMHGASGAAPFLNISIYRPSLLLPINTNDATIEHTLTSSLWSTSRRLLPFSLKGLGASPTSESEVAGVVQPRSGVILAAPPGLSFLSPCTPSYCAQVVPNFFANDRDCAVNLTSAQPSGQYSLRVRLPNIYHPNRFEWIAFVPGPQGGVREAEFWEAVAGFPLQPMPASVSYAAVANLMNVLLTVTFTPSAASKLLINGGNTSSCKVVVKVPVGYSVSCGSMFKMITDVTPATVLCQRIANTNNTEVMLSFVNANFTSVGDIVVALTLDVAAETPSGTQNMFGVKISARNVTIDANYGIPGLIIPPSRLRSNVSWNVQNVPSQPWMEAWVQTANSSGCFRDGIARAFSVSSSTVSIEHTYTVVSLFGYRRLQNGTSGSSGLLNAKITLTFAVALRLDPQHPNYESTLMAKYNLPYFGLTVKNDILRFLGYVGLKPMITDTPILTAPVKRLSPQVTDPTLSWTGAEADKLTKIALGMKFTNPTADVRGVLIIMPEGFRHEIKKLNDARVATWSGGYGFPVADDEGTWLFARNNRTVTVKTSAVRIVEKGTYSFQLPITVPSQMPVLNVWYLCLCNSDTCNSATHPSILMCFVIIGFEIDETPPSSATRIWEASGTSPCSTSTWMTWFMLLAIATDRILRVPR